MTPEQRQKLKDFAATPLNKSVMLLAMQGCAMNDPYAIYSTHLLIEECATPGCIVEGPHTEYDCETMPADDIWRDELWGEYWGRSVCRGYLPMWSWLHRRFEWLPTAALMDEWGKRCEVG